MLWAGVDVGGGRKGFHLAAIDQDLSVETSASRSIDECRAWLTARHPRVVAIDSPAAWAPNGSASRPCERDFARHRLCGIRFTPDAATANARRDTYYGWIHNGLRLWVALGEARLEAIECFPTASWTAWSGSRGSQRRAAWTREGLATLASHGVTGLETVRNQDLRDAVAAALTAKQHDTAPESTLTFDTLVVPHRQTLAAAVGRSVGPPS